MLFPPEIISKYIQHASLSWTKWRKHNHGAENVVCLQKNGHSAQAEPKNHPIAIQRYEPCQSTGLLWGACIAIRSRLHSVPSRGLAALLLLHCL